ncbi:hypothetical protein [Saccharothrix syringae]|uniref:Uncharacterized protein n=1 Tax=Saccharothrix syringae TaxID=103733 RepID=A0A5Q0HAS8_SACSY|nr:hypothetical protein [Saccharothrix syringae]QFZ23064.1 hypothetical protein EKG83_41560 [Saccharothrix syringae]
MLQVADRREDRALDLRHGPAHVGCGQVGEGGADLLLFQGFRQGVFEDPLARVTAVLPREVRHPGMIARFGVASSADLGCSAEDAVG